MLAGRLLIHIAACLFTVTCFAFDRVPVSYLGIEQGLSNNAVTTIFQDHNGFMWFGTYDGLNRFDGYTVKVFRNNINDTTSLKDNHVSVIEGDGFHRLWVGCEKGMSIYNPIYSNFTTPFFTPWNENRPRLLTDGIRAIRRIQVSDIMLVGTQKEGLILFEKNSLSGIQIPVKELKGRETNYGISAIAYDSYRQVAWIFIPETGLCQFNFRTKELLVINRSIKRADCLLVDRKGRLWLGNDNGLFQYNFITSSFSQNVLPVRYKVVNLFEDSKNVLWISSDGGGVWFMPGGQNSAKPYLSDNGTPVVNSNAVYSVYEDKEGGKWIGTLRGGVNVIHPRSSSFRHILYHAPNQNPVNNYILSFCEDEIGNVWIGTDGAGLRYWDRKKNTFEQYVHNAANPVSISSDFVTNILRDSGGDLWFATWFGGISRLKKDTRVFERFLPYNSKKGSTEDNAWLVYEDVQKRIWVSTTNEGTLYTFNRKRNAFELFDDKLVNIQSLAQDKAGAMWAGDYTSLIKIDEKNKKHLIYKIGYTVRCIYEDSNGNFWLGTDGGGLLLFNRETGSFKQFSINNGLPSNTILRLLEDRRHNLWLSTYNGLCAFNTITKTCRNYSQSDGLQSNQFSFNATVALKSGEFLFGGIKGFNVFYPDSVYNDKQHPRLFLTGLRINNRPVEDDASYVTKREFEKVEEITLPYSEAVLSLDFVALQYSGTDKIKYAYQLEGWDKTWNYVNNIRTAHYSRLEEGTYTFKIKVTNAAGAWSNETRLLTVTVLPPWYRTWWAYLFYIAALATLVWMYLSYNRRQERLKYEIRLAHLEKEKEKELTEKKISFFTHISHEFRTPLTLIINPVKELMDKRIEGTDGKAMATIYRNARRLLSLVDQLLLFRKVESIDEQLRIDRFDIMEVCREVYLCFGQHASSKTIDFQFRHPDKPLFIYGDKEKIEIIIFNLVSNAFKYTEANGKIVIEISEPGNSVDIAVQDTGCGVPPEIGDKLFKSFYRAEVQKTPNTGFGVGLFVSQKLAQAHQGQLSYTSEKGAGTNFCLSLKKGKEHFASQYISEDDPTGETILQELLEEPSEEQPVETAVENRSDIIDKLRSELPVMVLVDDNVEMRSYIKQIFSNTFTVYEADDGATGYELVQKELPDIVISDIMMKKESGIDLCRNIKTNAALAHIPVVLLTASSSDKIKLQGLEGGAEDYILKPFEKDIIIARVQNILKTRDRMQQYFFNAATLKPASNLPGEHKVFIEKCMAVVEAHLDDPDFTIHTLCKQVGMSHPSLYKKVKAVSGLTVNVFIRYIRLRKAAELLITTDKTILEVTYLTGFNDIRYFREQFQKLFKMNPSEYVKRYRKILGKQLNGSSPL